MATYKVIQDVEAEDKLVGPLTAHQFIYACIAAICLYLSFLSITKHAEFILVLTLPVALFTGFFAFPWGRDQPTELWALAKIRFYLKPRRRVWDQSGTKDLVSVTAPKTIERPLTNGLNQDEVQSRLQALANTIDSRGWAVKNINVSMSAPAAVLTDVSDRLVQASSLPQEVTGVDVRPSDDILDENANPIAHNFDSMINASSEAHRQQLIAQMQDTSDAPTAQTPANYWFMHEGATPKPGQATFVDTVVAPGTQSQPLLAPQAAAPTPEEEAMVAHFKEENSTKSPAYGHMKLIKTPEQLLEEDAARRAAQASAKPTVTPQDQAAIINFASNDDLDVATIARQLKNKPDNDDEVVISLR